ncbi:MAG TPA: zinc ribbon domain-containing protein [Pyrinomonadaceae bacterium]|nr:zinc ribbon domain-containing protein [Pyrinomonadaceae bacterium]
MYCPACGSEERQLSQYCRACGTDLRAIRLGLERVDSVTASAVSARDHISRAVADKIRETQSPADLKKVAEEVLPEIEKFLESPEEKRLRRIRMGVIFAAIGLGGTLISLLLTLEESDFLPLLLPGVVMFFIGLGIILNGIFFSLPRKELRDATDRAQEQIELDQQLRHIASLNPAPVGQSTTNELDARERVVVRPSVTEHTTHHLKTDVT